MTAKSLPIDLDEAKRFLKLLDPDASRFTFQTFDDQKKKMKALTKVLHGTLEQHASTLKSLNEAGAGIFVTVNETDLKGRRDMNVQRVRALFVDLDGAPLEPVMESKVLPHLVTETSPGRYHAFWMIEGLNTDEFTSIQESMARRFGGDISVTDLPRVMRLPGFYHRKSDEPFRVSIRHVSEEPRHKGEWFRNAPTADTPKIVEEGGRNTTLTSLAGTLRRRDLSAEAIHEALLAINPHVCSPPLPENEITNIVKSAGKWQSGSADVQEVNAAYAVTWAGTDVVILREGFDPELGRDTVWFVKPSDLKLLWANRFVEMGKKSKPVQLYDHWVTHPDRREYTGVVFAPGRDVPGAYNLWRGWSVNPDPSASCKLFINHLRNVICDGDEEVFRWVEGWLADAVQNPDRKPGTALVMRGPEGTGKGLFAQYVGAMYGEHFLHLTQGEHLVGRFNAHLKGSAMVFADEALFAGNRGHGNVLKGLITEKTLMLEMKYVNAFPVANRVRLMMASNEDWVVATGLDARRFCMLEVPPIKRGDTGYFRTLVDEMESGGPAALMDHLLKVDLSEIDLRNPPKTTALLDQKHLTMSPVQKWYFERLLDGYLLDIESDEWPNPDGDHGLFWVVGKDVYDDYLKHARNSNARFRDTPESFGKAIGKMCPGLVRKKKRMTVRKYDEIHMEYVEDSKIVNAHGYPPLKQCREDFEKMLGHKVEWAADDDMEALRSSRPMKAGDEDIPF